MLKYGCFPKSQGNGSVYYKFESLDLRPDGVMDKGMQVVFDNGNLLTYKCKYYNIVQCSDFRNTLNLAMLLCKYNGHLHYWSPNKD